MWPEENYILTALQLLPPSSQFRIANAQRPPSVYLGAQFLPEIGKPTYQVNSSNIRVHAIMAGLAGTSSNYPPGGFITASTINEQTAKIANHVELKEEDLRTLQMLVQNALAMRMPRGEMIANILRNLLNFFDKMVIQPHLDTMEFLRWQALQDGKLDWINNGIHLQVDYQIPASQFNTHRTGNDAWGGSASKFWDDWRFLQSALHWEMQAVVMHSNTWDVIQANPVNGIEQISREGNVIRARRIIETSAGNERISSDNRDMLTVILYSLEATKINDAKPTETLNVPFVRPGNMVGIGMPAATEFRVDDWAVGQGSTPDPEIFVPLGYTHIAPTVEGGGQIGRWAREYVPQERPYAFVGQGVTNGLPVIDSPLQVARASSDMPS